MGGRNTVAVSYRIRGVFTMEKEIMQLDKVTCDTQINIGDGKYTVLHDNGANLRALRHGKPWRDLVGDGLILAMAQEIESLADRLEAELAKPTAPDWQPIETAPHGVWILVCDEHGTASWQACWNKAANCFMWADGNLELKRAKYWQPMPAPRAYGEPNNPDHIGQKFEEFLAEEGLLEQLNEHREFDDSFHPKDSDYRVGLVEGLSTARSIANELHNFATKLHHKGFEGWADELRELCCRLWATNQKQPLEPVEGNCLPPLGATVEIHLASLDAWVPHTVVGYYVWNQHGTDDRSHHRVFVRVVDSDGIPNARMLKDVRWKA